MLWYVFHDVYKKQETSLFFIIELLFEYGFGHQTPKSDIVGNLTVKTTQL